MYVSSNILLNKSFSPNSAVGAAVLGNPGSATANTHQVSPNENFDVAVVAGPVRYIRREVELGEGEEDPEAWLVDVVVAVRHGFGARPKLTAITRHVRATFICKKINKYQYIRHCF